MPLQWHFVQKSHDRRLAAASGLGRAAQRAAGRTRRSWQPRHARPALARRKLSSKDGRIPDPAARKSVIDALRKVAASSHPDIHHDGIEILAALPPAEPAPLADMAVAWLGRDARFGFLQAPEQLVRKLAEGGHCAAALRIARSLLQVWSESGETATLYGRHMYEHYLRSVTPVLTKACGEDAFRLFLDLTVQAGEATRKLEYDHHSSRAIADDEMASHDVFSALVSAVRRSAEMVVAADPRRVGNVIALIRSHPAEMFIRLALHVLARKILPQILSSPKLTSSIPS